MPRPRSTTDDLDLIRELSEESEDAFGVPGDRFLFREMLGEGSFGAVYRCSRELNGVMQNPDFAVKVINAERIAALVGYPLELVGPRLRREVEVLRHLGGHPNILKLHFAYFSPRTHRFYLVTELLTGGELFNALLKRRKPFAEAEGKVIFKQLVDAIVFCHKMGVAHRDLKLENILFEAEGSMNVKLCDYGQAKMLQAGEGLMDTSRTLTTTPAYTAPEVARAVQASESYDAFKADAFGLGVVLYGLLCSALPDAAKGNTYERHRRWSQLSPSAQNLIKSLLSTDPDQRPHPARLHEHEWLAELRESTDDSRSAGRPRLTSLSEELQAAHQASPVCYRTAVEAMLAAQEVLVALQRERGTCCWALGSEEGETAFKWQVQYTNERFAEVDRMLNLVMDADTGIVDPRVMKWEDLQSCLTKSRTELTSIRRQCGTSIKNREQTLDVEEDIQEVFEMYNQLVGVLLASVNDMIPRLSGSGPPNKIELRLRLLQIAAEQLARERGFLSGHLARPETLRLSSVVTQLAEIIGARKVLLGRAKPKDDRRGCVVGGDAGLLPMLRLAEVSALEQDELASLEASEKQALGGRKIEAPAVQEWWYHLTKIIDKLHQHIMIGMVEAFNSTDSSVASCRSRCGSGSASRA